MRWSLFILVNLIFTQAIELESSENGELLSFISQYIGKIIKSFKF